MLNPDIKPVLITGGSSATTTTASVRRAPEKARVTRAVEAMLACGVRFERGRLEDALDMNTTAPMSMNANANAGWIYRMQPALDAMGVYETAGGNTEAGAGGKVRYAIRQVLEQEHGRELVRREQVSANARVAKAVGNGAEVVGEERERDLKKVIDNASVGVTTTAAAAVKRDFFGRPVVVAEKDVGDGGDDDVMGQKKTRKVSGEAEGRIWISYHEGFSNAVKKPITMKELLEGM